MRNGLHSPQWGTPKRTENWSFWGTFAFTPYNRYPAVCFMAYLHLHWLCVCRSTLNERYFSLRDVCLHFALLWPLFCASSRFLPLVLHLTAYRELLEFLDLTKNLPALQMAIFSSFASCAYLHALALYTATHSGFSEPLRVMGNCSDRRPAKWLLLCAVCGLSCPRWICTLRFALLCPEYGLHGYRIPNSKVGWRFVVDIWCWGFPYCAGGRDLELAIDAGDGYWNWKLGLVKERTQ
jgi:hypothetical protein